MLSGHGLSRPQAQDSPGVFTLAENHGVWRLVTPAGEPFFSMGVNVVNMGAIPEDYRDDLPEYAAFRHYGSSTAWVEATLGRFRRWNFNTLGAWSDYERFADDGKSRLPFVVELGLGRSMGAPWSDLFSDIFARGVDVIASRKITAFRDNPQLIGYFSDNELGWWDETIFYHFLKQPPSNHTRRVLINLLREHYRGGFAALVHDFEPGSARSFEDLEAGAQLKLRAGGQGARVIDRFVALVAERYYSVCREAIRRYDDRHLLLGDRYLGWYSPTVARIAAQYVDCISINYGADWNDGRIARFYLDSLHRLTGKPILISELYFTAMENRSGNRNTGGMFPTVRTQRERAESFRRYLSTVAALPYVVGAHWFQYYDEPSFGRGDGEDFNMGLVDIEDRPYEELTEVAAALRPENIHASVDPGETAATTAIGLPRANADPEAGLRNWDVDRMRIAPEPHAAPFADLYACWDEGNLYLAAYVIDFAEKKLYAGETIPQGDRIHWTIESGKGNAPLHVWFGLADEPAVTTPGLAAKFSQVSIRHTAIVTIPASRYGGTSFKAGDELTLEAHLRGMSGAAQMRWNRRLRLTENQNYKRTMQYRER